MKTIRDIVNLLNEHIFEKSDKYDSDYFRFLEFVETPMGDYIKYAGNVLWDSENCSHFDEPEEGTLEEYLVGEIKKISISVKDVLIILEQK